MKTFEILKENINIPIKELASELHVSKENVYKWLDGSQKNPIDRLQVIMDNSNSTAILDHLCQKNGGYYMKAVNTNVHSASICSDACKEFGELLTALSVSLEDGKITKSEYQNIQKEFSDVVNVIQGGLDFWSKELELELLV